MGAAQNIPVSETGHAPVTRDPAKRGENAPKLSISIDFNNVDINVFIKFISELTATNFIVDPRVKGDVTIISSSRISLEEAYKVFESVLEVHGYTTVEAGEVVKILPIPDARTRSIQTLLGHEGEGTEDKVITQLVPLRYADPAEIKQLLMPMIAKSSLILAYEPTNTLIISDIHSNIQRLLLILKEIDIPAIGRKISLVPVEYAEAAKLAQLLGTITDSQQKTAKEALEKAITMVADERTNTIILLANEVDTRRIKNLISMMDTETPRGGSKIHVYYCENANAEELAGVLQNFADQGSTAQNKGTGSAAAGNAGIKADKATNSLIITAGQDDYRVLEEVIKMLDIPRSMVFIESLIVEVDMEKSLDFGIEWQVFGSATLGGKNTLVGGGFGDTLITSDSLEEAITPAGFSLGLISTPVEIAGVTVSNIAAMVNAIKSDSDFRILSTPQILATDNEEAKITVGENRPYQTQSTTTDSGGTYESFEYRDVGKIFKVTPHVTEGKLVRLELSLEVTNIDETSTATTSSTLPVTRKRTIDTTVIVHDGQTLAIGGLIDDSSTVSTTKVPALGDVPVLGWLFKSNSQERIKTNLFIFLSPKVIGSPLEADKIFDKRKGAFNPIREGSIKMYESIP